MNPMDEKRIKEERKPPEPREAAEVPAGEKLDDQDLTGAAGGMALKPQWADDHYMT